MTVQLLKLQLKREREQINTEKSKSKNKGGATQMVTGPNPNHPQNYFQHQPHVNNHSVWSARGRGGGRGRGYGGPGAGRGNGLSRDPGCYGCGAFDHSSCSSPTLTVQQRGR